MNARRQLPIGELALPLEGATDAPVRRPALPRDDAPGSGPLRESGAALELDVIGMGADPEDSTVCREVDRAGARLQRHGHQEQRHE